MRDDERKTVLRDNEVVEKTDPRVRLSGKLDSLMAQAVLACSYATRYGYTNVTLGCGDLIRVTRELFRAQKDHEKPAIKTILGLTMDELRDSANNPRSELGLDHYTPDDNTDLMTAHLNVFRARVREVELDFCEAPDNEVNREIQFVLNRLSCAAYILMLECRSERV